MNIENKCGALKTWELVNFCEFDKYAVKSYCAIHNESEDKNLGDITKVDETKLNPFNMIVGGSPCQDFSVAGKQKGSVWTCKDCGSEYNPLTVHWSKRNCCPHCGSENLDKSRSSLLVEWLRVIRANRPNLGIYENVKNIVGKQFKETTFRLFTNELVEYGYNVYWKVLNAKDYGVPQNRERVYLIIIKKELDNGKFKYPESFDNGIRLKDILADEVDEKYYISEDKVNKFLTNMKSNEEHIINTPVRIENVYGEQFGTGYAGNVWDKESISPTIMTMQGGGRQPHVVDNKVIHVGNLSSSQDGAVVDPRGISKTHTAGHNNQPKIICGIDKSINETKEIDNANCITAREDRGISNRRSEGTAVLETPDYSYCLDANYFKGTTIEQYVDKHRRQLIINNNGDESGNKVLINQATKRGYIECEVGGVADLSYPDSKTRRGRVQDGGSISPTITATETGICRIESQIRIRKLTPLECFRLMGFSDEYFYEAEKVVSNSQLYKQAGNSIVVDVLYYILLELYKAMPYLFDDLKLGSYFSGIGAFEAALDKLFESINSGNFTRPQVD